MQERDQFVLRSVDKERVTCYRV